MTTIRHSPDATDELLDAERLLLAHRVRHRRRLPASVVIAEALQELSRARPEPRPVPHRHPA